MGELKTLALNFSWARVFFAIKHDLLVCQDVSRSVGLGMLCLCVLSLFSCEYTRLCVCMVVYCTNREKAYVRT